MNNDGVKRSLYAVKVTRFVCLACGFSEEWIESKGDLQEIKKKFGKK